ncbi:MAG TPA: hypothetical protein VGP96_02000 [Candidatus Dormibacteraeota bacterium]|jgi:hypothetical protein|nr:hypothetical protein [Candidatus Dormibacteraeota bacterium]
MRRETWSIVAMAAFAVLAIPGQMLLGAVSRPSRAAPLGLDTTTVRRVYAALPLAFEANPGQVGPDAGFVARGSGYAFLVGARGATLAFSPGARRGRSGPRPAAATAPALEVMRIELIGADAHAPVRLGPTAGTTGSFLGSDATHWRTAVPDYTRIEYQGVYPGIDLVYHGLQGSLEYDFVVAPGADPQQIRLRVDGAPSSLGSAGEVALALPGGTAVQHPPTTSQLPPASPPEPHPTATARPARPLPAGHRRPGASPSTAPVPVPVTSGYVPGRGGELHLGLGAYDRSRPLIIDPVVTWSPAIGGGLDDSFVSTVDRAGAAYVVTGSPSPAAADGGPVTTDVAVLKLDRAGRVIYRTFLGGDGTGGPSEVTVDDTGALEISGTARPATGAALLADGPGRRFTMRVDPRGLPLPQTGAAAG